ncbi:MAG: DNA helicase PcrA [Promicromonosporaceae bacterium]|nr:DNA helicase PcrA [Promicromonosporaceae bacterium]
MASILDGLPGLSALGVDFTTRLPVLAPNFDDDGWGSADDDTGGWGSAQEYTDDPWGIGTDDDDDAAPAPSAEELLEGLNEQQRAAVLHAGSPLLIVAGAGSGKTRVLTHRIAYLIATKRAWPSQILAITFTNKAAAEMRERVIHLVGEEGARMWVSTFHSACLRILRREYQHVDLRSSFSIYDTADTLRLITIICKELNLDPKKNPPRGMARKISDLKNELITPETYAARGDADHTLATVYSTYQRRLTTANSVDFDDIIMLTVKLLTENPAVAEHYRRRFRHILVDEYQDTNHAQYMLIRELVGGPGSSGWEGSPPAGELTVVGDADQSIYAFRGATIRNINQFEEDYPDATTILLEQNYRSTQNILDAANAVISRNPGRAPKSLWTSAGSGAQLIGYTADDEYGEARYIAKEIDRLADEAGVRHGDVAIFYRANAQSRVLEEILIRVGLPYRIVGGTRFYERREIKDAVAYLQALANLDDDVNLRRIVNVPKRGIGDKAESLLAGYAATSGVSFGTALSQAHLIPGLTARTLNPLKKFAAQFAAWRERVAAGDSPAALLTQVLEESGYLASLQTSEDPQDATRVENLAELVAVATEFAELYPTANLADFLERIALVADADQLPAAADADPDAPRDPGVITLMTLHTAKGLEFPVVFLTGMEDGTFPHMRSMFNAEELAEERRLAYVGLTRARERLYLTRSALRSAWGTTNDMPESRFLADVPEELIDWERRISATESIRNSTPSWSGTSSGGGLKNLDRTASSSAQTASRSSSSSLYGSGGHWGSSKAATEREARRERTGSVPPKEVEISPLSPGDRVTHDSFGLGKVIEVEGTGRNTVARVDFGSEGTKRLLLRFAPLQKL